MKTYIILKWSYPVSLDSYNRLFTAILQIVSVLASRALADCGLGVRRVAARQPEEPLASCVRDTADVIVFVAAAKAGHSVMIFWR